jgi:hypothetical protein
MENMFKYWKAIYQYIFTDGSLFIWSHLQGNSSQIFIIKSELLKLKMFYFWHVLKNEDCTNVEQHF